MNIFEERQGKGNYVFYAITDLGKQKFEESIAEKKPISSEKNSSDQKRKLNEDTVRQVKKSKMAEERSVSNVTIKEEPKITGKISFFNFAYNLLKKEQATKTPMRITQLNFK